MSNPKKISIIDYGVGNLHSLCQALNQYADVSLTEEPGKLMSADAIVLPGDGAFHAGMEGLRVRELLTPLKERIRAGVPILGICLGAQILLTKGFEFGEWEGLHVIPGTVVKFPDTTAAKIPHINWNALIASKGNTWENTILEGVPAGTHVYFVHSFILMPENNAHILAETSYGGTTFCSVVRSGRVYGCQFHPEKSGEVGLRVIENFIKLI